MIDIETLKKYEKKGLLRCNHHPKLPLIIWNYTLEVQYENLWDEITLQCRGLVTDESGNIVARPFKKFFNIEQSKHTPTKDFEVFEKMDGSLGICFLYERKVVCATRGSFISEQAQWMKNYTEKYNFKYILVEGFTYLFEIIYPENRIVVDYGDKERLVLLSIIETGSSKEIPYEDIEMDGWDIVNKYDEVEDYTTLKSKIKDNFEGFVVKFSNGDRVKIKGEEYIRLYKIITQISTKSIWKCLSNNDDITDYLNEVPDEFYDKVKDYENELKEKYKKIEKEYKWIFKKTRYDYFKVHNREFSRKEFAPIALQYTYPKILFCMLDGKDYSSIIWNILKPQSRPIW